MANGISGQLDFSSFDNALKIIYSKQAVVDETYKNRPFHALIGKETDFGGRSFVFDVISSQPQGRSAQFNRAQANKTGIQIDQFTVIRAYDFALASVDVWTMLSAEGEKNSLLQALTGAINGARKSIMRSVAMSEFRDGTGVLGQVVSTAGSGPYTIVINRALDITNFEKNMSIVAYAPVSAAYDVGIALDGTATKRVGANTITAPDGTTSAGVMFVKKVDRTSNLTLTVDALATSIAQYDYLLADGDYGTNTVGSVTALSKITGLSGWLPYGGPTSTAFFGLDRTTDNVRLAGWSSNQIGKSADEAVLNASMEVFTYGGGMPDYAMVSPIQFNNIVKLQGPTRRVVDVKAKGTTIGFKALEVLAQGGPLKIMADPNCPDRFGYLLQMEDWKLKTLGALPRFINPNGQTLTQATANQIEVRVGYAGNVYCKAPTHSGVLAFS